MNNGKRVFRDGTACWYRNGRLHRTDGPAVLYQDGTEYWYNDGKLHRTDGPAIVRTCGPQEWFINDESVDPLVAFLAAGQDKNKKL